MLTDNKLKIFKKDLENKVSKSYIDIWFNKYGFEIIEELIAWREAYKIMCEAIDNVKNKIKVQR